MKIMIMPGFFCTGPPIYHRFHHAKLPSIGAKPLGIPAIQARAQSLMSMMMKHDEAILKHHVRWRIQLGGRDSHFHCS